MKKIIYPGTFDPITNGHLDIAKRAAVLFDHVILAIANHPKKNSLFTVEERIDLIQASIEHLDNVSVSSTDALIVRFAKENEAIALIRGLRSISDFEYEFQMALMNRSLAPEISTVFMMPDERYMHLNSTVVKEIAALEGDISAFVPAIVEAQLKSKLNK
ncbi:MAG TPA: pantetheine-phosphate adenylyltransferase [Candidatus Marinimicrobia bacterium]|nr:pantetheine-phosphate adenylyltransferase [Candidatus Neomarinimicrobiota bacterium]HIM27550.1 pantetheine-phosphate adenylyltransferase [Candidatus Neomarinimicrobiota bacterium]HIN26976.1 pantetheine-phosphate adenylyltransferase [Candidatus Neomarinimicrobiota bacterium]